MSCIIVISSSDPLLLIMSYFLLALVPQFHKETIDLLWLFLLKHGGVNLSPHHMMSWRAEVSFILSGVNINILVLYRQLRTPCIQMACSVQGGGGGGRGESLP